MSEAKVSAIDTQETATETEDQDGAPVATGLWNLVIRH